ncbi:HAD hydrolase-like protein, partial [Salmonella enterica subsp. enterica serovar Montevideo]|nr:HAD hydrolase-like protein [Salmonella enterica subsp. enterica serovar Montevideo]
AQKTLMGNDVCRDIRKAVFQHPKMTMRRNDRAKYCSLRVTFKSEETVIVGDNLRTDILAGFQAGLETILVLSGVSTINDIDSMP